MVARICSGKQIIIVNDKRYVIDRLTPEQNYIAEEIYTNAYISAKEDECPDEVEMLAFVRKRNLWTVGDENQINEIAKDIEKLKVGLFQVFHQKSARSSTRKMLESAKIEHEKLASRKRDFDYLTCNVIAAKAKLRYTVGARLKSVSGSSLFKNSFYVRNTSNLLEKAIAAHTENFISEAEYRELARTEPWKTIWACKKAENGLFGVPSVQYTEEQKNLVSWSLLYDNIGQHPECPIASVLEDDDALDGWLILQKRAGERESKQKLAEGLLTNDKIANSDEVFVMNAAPGQWFMEDTEEINLIESLNDEHASSIKRQRDAALAKSGTLLAQQMPDVKREIQMELNKMRTQ